MTAPVGGASASTSQGDSFGAYVRAARDRGALVVQPRMGFGDPGPMRRGLAATRDARATTVGTLTLDSYTRVGDHESARQAVAEGGALNGYPIVARDRSDTLALLDGIRGPDFPVQVRHGSAAPQDIFRALSEVGLDATEGGPVSYCLPYGRTPLRDSLDNWRESTEIFAAGAAPGRVPHIESFGGCMLGQLCPPGMLVAMTLLEGVFFAAHGIRSVSLSYAQQTNSAQDREAVRALRRLAGEFLPGVDWHVVLYTYMGVYPRTRSGALALLTESARTAVAAGADRVIVKTEAEAHRIPTIEENVRALETAARASEAQGREPEDDGGGETYTEARTLVAAVLEQSDDVGSAMLRAFSRGLLDIPFCLHPDNAGRVRSYIDDTGRLRWADTGGLPLPTVGSSPRNGGVTSQNLLSTLSYVEQRYDGVEQRHDGAAIR